MKVLRQMKRRELLTTQREWTERELLTTQRENWNQLIIFILPKSDMEGVREKDETMEDSSSG